MFILILVVNLAALILDVLAFGAVIRQVWALWKEKRRLHLHTNKDFVTLLFQQGILRFSLEDQISAPFKTLSSLLICEFTMDLRRRNETKLLPNRYALELPDLNQHNPDNIIADMGERNDQVGVTDGQSEERSNQETA
ncbi:hypothetical protein Clacol_004353 [Clathrus columnatus]|uniref:Uncharacterized protein n=1 Tax=Clathrus columnatus TaxID=1419009 RepID=A0AAV5A692_9AGAM|nr:hypothetical protein Clacol_004353 [Clathrus columnatus]